MDMYLIFLALFYGGVKGVCGGLLLYGATPLFIATLQVNSTQFQIALTLAAIPWATKAIVAIISDTYPILGWYKRYYVLVYIMLLLVSLISLSAATTFSGAAAALTTASAGVAFSDILLEGHYTESVSFRNADKRLPSYVWAFTTAGNGIAAVLVGTVAHSSMTLRTLFAASVTIPVFIIIMLSTPSWAIKALPGDLVNKAPAMTVNLLNTERRTRVGTFDRIQHRKPSTEEWFLSIGLAIVALTLLVGISTIESSSSTISILIVAILMIAGLLWGLLHTYGYNSVFAHMTIYVFLCETLSVNVASVVDYWFVAGDNCVLDGPQLNWLTYITVPAVVGSVACIITSACYAEHGYAFTVRSTMQLGGLLRIVGSLIGELTPTTLSNDAGIITCLICGIGVLYTAGAILQTLSMCTFVARLVNRGTETCQFAIMVSIANLGMACAKLAGLVFIHAFSVNAVKNSYSVDTHACNYTHYSSLLVLTRVLLPFGAIVFGYVLAPPARRLTKK